MNRLGEETSPYLRQHRDNPVDWYPWGEEAFALARQTDRPIFVSIGYAACHWCHVMAHESFEDEAVARLLNERFVSIKVDREERPEIDAIYLEAVQALTGSGGWPLSVFLDHERKPFFGGTYFPPRDAHGLPSFTKLLDAIATAWTERRADLLAQSEEITNVIAERLAPARSASEISATEVDTLFSAAIESYAARFDTVHGGLGAAPKFPQPPMLELLCEGAARDESGAREMLEATLLSMASGGIYDQIGGGFARYSVDRAWLVPHFEKMLYDQAGLARVYLHAFELTGDARYRQVVEESLDYVLRDLRLPDGGIASSEDADSEGEEGLFYLWDLEQLQALLGDRAEEAAAFYGVTKSGNFEGRNILHVAERGAIERSPEIEAARQILFAARTNRVRPGLDDKVITEWNAMIAGALAEAAGALSHPGYRQAAIEIAEFCWTNLRDTSGRVMRSWQDGRARHLGTANDYAWLIDCFTRLYEATGEDEWLGRAEVLAQDLIELFSAEDGAFFLAGSDGESLIVRPQDSHDGVVPAAGSIATSALARLGALVSDGQLIARAERALGARSVLLKSAPLAVPHLLQAARSLVRGSVEVVVSGELPELVSLLQASYLPGSVLAWGIPSPRPLWEGRESPGAYVCRRGVCELPVQAPTELIAALDAATSR